LRRSAASARGTLTISDRTIYYFSKWQKQVTTGTVFAWMIQMHWK
jgi:hypothetical protein